MSVPSTQSALLLTELGKPLVKTTSHPVPSIGDHQLLIRVTVAAVNPHDEKDRAYGLFNRGKFPAIITNDVVGTVAAVHPTVKKFKIGDRVVTQSTFYGDLQNGFQEYAQADEDYTAMIPDGFTDDDAATLPCNVIAPLVSLFDKLNLGLPAPWTRKSNANVKLLILGGGSNCGKFGVQLAALSGIGKIVVVGGPEEELKKYGATDVLDRHGSHDELLKRILAVVPEGFEYVYDAINPPETQLLGIDALSTSKGGKYTRLLPTGPVDESKVSAAVKEAGYEILDTYGWSQGRPETCKPFWEHLPTYLKEGKIIPLKYEVFKGLDADKANAVLDKYRDGKPVIQAHFHIQE